MDRSRLKSLAEAGNGSYTELATAGKDPQLWGSLDGAEFARRDDALGERWKDTGPWLVLLLIPLVLAGFRRGLFFLLPLVLANGLLLPQPAQAGWWEDLWQRKDQQAFIALRDGDPQKAAALAKDPSLSGEAWYRSEDYINALESWTGLDTADAHYNRGNALAMAGNLDGALAAYDRALELDPDMLDAIYNRKLVEELKKQQEEEQQGDQGESGESEESEEQSESEESEEQQEGEEGEQGESSEEQESEQQENSEAEQQEQQVDYAEEWSEEDAQAMEQWLRRIPDDPGGLLRRKFRNQHQRRGAPEDESETW
jgi:Ca-activated chloride channel family protein